MEVASLIDTEIKLQKINEKCEALNSMVLLALAAYLGVERLEK